jgi:hypothetical protein
VVWSASLSTRSPALLSLFASTLINWSILWRRP